MIKPPKAKIFAVAIASKIIVFNGLRVCNSIYLASTMVPYTEVYSTPVSDWSSHSMDADN